MYVPAARSRHPDRPMSAGCSKLVGMRFVLLHSPLVGPTTWRWTAEALMAAGHEAAVPDLRDAAVRRRPEAMISVAVAAAPPGWSTLAIVGHSGAGSILPSVADRLGGRARSLVFVDAGLPPLDGRATPSAEFLDQLRTFAVDGVLPNWSTWWGEGVMEMLVSDAGRRAEIEAEIPEVPLAFFESPVEVPERWWETPGAFLLLSDAYRDDAERARTLGWPVVERHGGHLDIVNDADDIARRIAQLAT
jgi:hypothetical protein